MSEKPASISEKFTFLKYTLLKMYARTVQVQSQLKLQSLTE
jgi:hypothetical protein